MGTVGLSFGSATSGQGFDVATTVASILGIQQGIETPWKNQLTALQAQDTALSTIGTDLGTLSTSVQALTDLEGVTAEKEGASSNPDVVSLSSATSAATAGTHSVLVSRLAQTSSYNTSAVANAQDTLTGSLTVQVGPTGTPQTITVGASSVTIQSGTATPQVISGTSNTLSSLAAAINSAGIGVTASLITDTTGTRLSLVSGTGGTAGQLTVSSALTDATTATAVTAQQGLPGQDASLTVDGAQITSGTNTISTAIPGVTFQILDTSTNPIQVQITNDTSAVGTAMQAFVTAYNTVAGDLKTQEGNDSSGNPEPLYGNPTTSLLQTQLSEALNAGAPTGSISSISQLGVAVNPDGTLTYTDSTMQSNLNSNFNDVVGFLQNVGGWGLNMSSTMDSLSSSTPTGAVYLAQQQNEAQETSLNTDVSNEETLLATEKTSLTTELNTANQELQAIPSQLSEISEMYSAVTGYNNTNG